MKHLLFLLFLSGLVPVLVSVPRKFYLIQQTKTWRDAQTFCRTNHNDLATIESAADVVKLNNLGPGGWVGLYLSWRWSFGNQELGNTTFWSPTFTPPVQGCGAVSSLGWWDTICSQSYYFMCFDGSYTGNSRYIVYQIGYTWRQAQTYCRLHHTDLASDRNATEHAVIYAKLSTATLWFGLYSEGWRWSDQTSVSYNTWMTGQPSNTVGINSCGYFNNSLTYESKCSNLNVFFCHRIITGQQQIVRVKVRSNQNLNDDAVNSVSLELIKQKLKELGINGVTLKWRKQPDGRVFQK